MALATGQINIQNIDETIQVIFSKENHVFAGGVTSALAGSVVITVKAFIGNTQVGCTIGTITPSRPSGLAVTAGTGTGLDKTITMTATTSLIQAAGTYNIPVKVGSTTINKTLSYSIAFTGTVGQGIKSISEQYILSTLSSTAPAEGDSWLNVSPPWEPGKYLWTRNKVIYKNPTATSYTTPYVNSTWDAVAKTQEQIFLLEAQNMLLAAETAYSAYTNRINLLLENLEIGSEYYVLLDSGKTSLNDLLIRTVDSVNDIPAGLKTLVNASIAAGEITSEQYEGIYQAYILFEEKAKEVEGRIRDANLAFEREKTKEIIDSLQIGTKNLLLNTNFSRGTAEWSLPVGVYTLGQNETSFISTSTAGAILSQEIGKGYENLTLSFEAKGSATIVDAGLPTERTINSVLKVSIEETNTDNIASTVYTAEYFLEPFFSRHSFRMPDLKPFSTYKIIFELISGSYDLTYVKAETGLVASDWTPAPEDADTLFFEILSANRLSRADRGELLRRFEEIQVEHTVLMDGFYDQTTDTDINVLLDVMDLRFVDLKTILDPILGLEIDAEGNPTNEFYSEADIVEYNSATVAQAFNAYSTALNNFKKKLFYDSFTISYSNADALLDKLDASREAVMSTLIDQAGGPEANFIYLDETDGKIYINGEYIKGKTISADLLKGQVLSSVAGNTYINLNDGTFNFGNGALTYDEVNGLVFGGLASEIEALIKDKAEQSALEDTTDTATSAFNIASELQSLLDDAIKIGNGKITIGSATPGGIRFEIENEKATFYYQDAFGADIALGVFANDSLTAARVVAEESLQVGDTVNKKYKMVVKENGNLSFIRG